MSFKFKYGNSLCKQTSPRKIIAKKINRNTFPNGWRETLAMLYSTSYHVSCPLQTLAAVLKTNKNLKSCTYILYFQTHNSNLFNNHVSWQKKCIWLSKNLWTQVMNISHYPSKAGQKNKFIIQDIIYSYLRRAPLYIYITNKISVAPFFWKQSVFRSTIFIHPSKRRKAIILPHLPDFEKIRIKGKK